jgi:hypothetical protein
MDCLVVVQTGTDVRLRATIGALQTGRNLVDLMDGIFSSHSRRVVERCGDGPGNLVSYILHGTEGDIARK